MLINTTSSCRRVSARYGRREDMRWGKRKEGGRRRRRRCLPDHSKDNGALGYLVGTKCLGPVIRRRHQLIEELCE